MGCEFETTKVRALFGGTTSPLGERHTDSGAHFLLLILSLTRKRIAKAKDLFWHIPGGITIARVLGVVLTVPSAWNALPPSMHMAHDFILFSPQMSSRQRGLP